MEEALAGLRLEDELANALLGRSKLRDTLGRLAGLLQAYEDADRVRTYAIAHDLRIPLTALHDVYMKATAWAVYLSVRAHFPTRAELTDLTRNFSTSGTRWRRLEFPVTSPRAGGFACSLA